MGRECIAVLHHLWWQQDRDPFHADSNELLFIVVTHCGLWSYLIMDEGSYWLADIPPQRHKWWHVFLVWCNVWTFIWGASCPLHIKLKPFQRVWFAYPAFGFLCTVEIPWSDRPQPKKFKQNPVLSGGIGDRQSSVYSSPRIKIEPLFTAELLSINCLQHNCRHGFRRCVIPKLIECSRTCSGTNST